jgi:hypothetical protein
MTALEKYLLFVIIVWRVTHLVRAEDGPFDLLLKIRNVLGKSVIGSLVGCFYCLSIWVGLAAALIEGDSLREIIILTLYYSGASLLLEKMTNKELH